MIKLFLLAIIILQSSTMDSWSSRGNDFPIQNKVISKSTSSRRDVNSERLAEIVRNHAQNSLEITSSQSEITSPESIVYTAPPRGRRRNVQIPSRTPSEHVCKCLLPLFDEAARREGQMEILLQRIHPLEETTPTHATSSRMPRTNEETVTRTPSERVRVRLLDRFKEAD
jgi:hypothetical protein